MNYLQLVDIDYKVSCGNVRVILYVIEYILCVKTFLTEFTGSTYFHKYFNALNCLGVIDTFFN